MYAHKLRIVAAPSTDVVVRLPADFPPGAAEVIVLSDVHAPPQMRAEARPPRSAARATLLQALARRFPLEPSLGPLITHEAPDAPLGEEEWPAELRP